MGRGPGAAQVARRRGDRAGGARVGGGGGAEGTGHRFELGLDDVVRVPAVEHADVQADARRVRERLEDVPGHRRVVRADHRRDALRLGVHDVRPPGQVDGRLHQHLVERHQRVTEPRDPRFVAEGASQRLTERQRHVLDRVVRVDLDVTLTPDHQVEHPVLGKLRQHVVEEPDTGRDIGNPRPVDVELHQDRCFLGVT
jgi:hypothetical protein